MKEETLKTPGVAALILGVCLVLSAVVVVSGIYQVRGLSDSLSVTGSAEKIISSDVVKWRSNFSRTVPVSGTAMGYADMKRDLSFLEAYLKSSGVAQSEITINPITVNQVYGSNGYGPTGNISGYTLSQEILIESKEIDKIIKTAKESGELISKGLLFSSQPVEFYYSDLASVKLEILGNAMSDARKRAESIAKSGGSRVSKLKSASMGVIQITSPNSADVSDYGYYDTSSRDKKITAVVKASFILK